jgi:aminoglycoside 6'-N-acetyltransferase I
MKRGVTIREAAAPDAAAWLEMRDALWPDAGRADLEREITEHFASGAPALRVFVADDAEGRPVGMLEMSLRSCADGCVSMPVPYVEGWYVVPAMRRRGVGGALIRAAAAWARDHGYTELASDTQLWNEDSARAHRALGFEEVERAIHFRLVVEPPRR